MIEITASSWSNYKTLVSNKKMLMQYEETTGHYFIYAIEANAIAWKYTITKGTSDATDFENNYESSCNQPLEIKEIAGKPARIASSAQPAGTAEKWIGFSIDFGSSDTTKTQYVIFNSLVYLRGGYMLPDNVLNGDIMDVSVEAYIDEEWVEIIEPWDNIALSQIAAIVFISNESMQFPTTYRLAVTITSQASTARKYYGVANFFE